MSYATIAQLTTRYDVRKIGELISDTGSAVVPSDVLSNSIVQAALDDASARVLQFALIGQRYSEDDLNLLATNNDSALVRITCDLAMAFIVQRRLLDINTYPQVKEGLADLERLRNGEMMFNVARDVAVGTATTGFPSVVQQSQTNSVTYEAQALFGPPRVQHPIR